MGGTAATDWFLGSDCSSTLKTPSPLCKQRSSLKSQHSVESWISRLHGNNASRGGLLTTNETCCSTPDAITGNKLGEKTPLRRFCFQLETFTFVKPIGRISGQHAGLRRQGPLCRLIRFQLQNIGTNSAPLEGRSNVELVDEEMVRVKFCGNTPDSTTVLLNHLVIPYVETFRRV